MTDNKDDRGTLDLTFLIDDKEKTIAKLKERNGFLEEQMVVLNGAKRVVTDLSAKMLIYDKENKELKEKVSLLEKKILLLKNQQNKPKILDLFRRRGM